MNRYPRWKYVLIGLILLIALIYALPNFFGEVPAVQVSPVKTTEKVDNALLGRTESALKAGNIHYDGAFLDGNSIKLRLATPDDQIKARDAIQAALGERYTVALNLLSASPHWLSALRALPMYLGLDLRGGVYFLLEVDMQGALDKAAVRTQNDVRSALRSEKIRYSRVSKIGRAHV
jgi:preprotein translocase subunit SecD